MIYLTCSVGKPEADKDILHFYIVDIISSCKRAWHSLSALVRKTVHGRGPITHKLEEEEKSGGGDGGRYFDLINPLIVLHCSIAFDGQTLNICWQIHICIHPYVRLNKICFGRNVLRHSDQMALILELFLY